MAKTRSQTGNIAVKKEEVEEDRKPTLLLNDVNSTTRNKITKRKPSKNRSRNLLVPDIKMEEDTDIKPLLQSPPKPSKLPKGLRVSQEQINQLIDYVVNDKMSIHTAAPKANMSGGTAYYYYNEYKNDPDKRIPSPRNRCTYAAIYYTQEQIKNLIKYMNNVKMPLKEASAKANISYQSGHYYYRKYLNDPDHRIPIPFLGQHYTQDQKSELIRYIIDDKMTIPAASKKAKMSVPTGRKYYCKYFNDQNPDIATPSHVAIRKRYAQEQIKELVSYIIDDKMSISAASRKVKMSFFTGNTFYRQYLKDHNMEYPLSRNKRQYTQDQKNELMRYIVDDKMTIKAASKKANIAASTGHKYCQQYLKENNIRATSSKYTQDQKNEFIGYIVDENMDVMAASKKANIHYSSGKIYYRKYRKEHHLDSPALKHRQNKIKELAGYIIDDRMTVKAASKKANIHYTTGIKYYRQYLKDQKRDASN